MKQLRGVVASVGASRNFPERCFLDRLTRLKQRPRKTVAALVVFAACGVTANANLNIVATYDPTIATNANSAAIETAINNAITILDGDILNNITVNIEFAGMTNGLGSSFTDISNVTYSSYVNALQTKQTLSANDNTAIASLGTIGANNPVNGTGTITTSSALLRALGYAITGDVASTEVGLAATNILFDSIVQFNLGLENFTRPGANNNNYDLESTAEHEIDEVLGIGGGGSQIKTNLSSLTGSIGPLDLYRYGAAGVRSFTNAANVASFFSINGGTNKLVNFNQLNDGSDYGDWGDGTNPAHGFGNNPAFVQDAFGTPGTNAGVDVGINELTGLDVIGWNMVPEPSTTALVVVGVLGTAWSMRRRRKG